MKIIHYCLSNFYIDGLGYQENELIRRHVDMGHDVLVLASTENFNEKREIYYGYPGEYIGGEGARVIRLPYRGWPPFVARKLRAHPRVYEITKDFQPDVMISHDICGFELLTMRRYKKNNPQIRFYADSHTDLTNSARSFLSREVLHRLFYKPIARFASQEIDKILCVSVSVMEFLQEVYEVDPSRLEFFPLGGTPLPPDVIAEKRAVARTAYGVAEDEVLFVQSGKQTRRKKLIESLRAFAATPDPNFRLFVVGRLFDDIREEAEALIARDERVRLLGWKTPDELTDLLCAADVYLQPGTQSATMQNSLCAGCAVIIDDVPSHGPFMRNNGWLVNKDRPLERIFRDVSERRSELEEMGRRSSAVAFELLDYDAQAKRLLQ